MHAGATVVAPLWAVTGWFQSLSALARARILLSPADVEAVARAVGKLFERDAFATKKELEEMKKLAADAALHFPSEFQLAQENPQAVRMSFKRAAAASAAMGV